MAKPTVGRQVHYTNLGDKDGKYPPEIQAATITGVKQRPARSNYVLVDEGAPVPELKEEDYVVDLWILYRTGQFWMLDVPYTTAPAGTDEARGRWTWPERVS